MPKPFTVRRIKEIAAILGEIEERLEEFGHFAQAADAADLADWLRAHAASLADVIAGSETDTDPDRGIRCDRPKGNRRGDEMTSEEPNDLIEAIGDAIAAERHRLSGKATPEDYARAALSALMDGPVFEAMVERLQSAIWDRTDGDYSPGYETVAAFLRAALTPVEEPQTVVRPK